MSGHVDVLRRVFEAWNADDVEAALEFADPEIELDFRGYVLFPGLREFYAGHDGFREWWAASKEPWEYFRTTPGRFITEGDKAVAPVRFEAKGRSSGVAVELDFANAWTFRGEKIAKFEGFNTLEEALEAAGISG